MSATSPITTHVLDTSRGRPAAGIGAKLERLAGADAWQTIGAGNTNSDGRITSLMPPDSLAAGRYRIVFAVTEYFQSIGVSSFYPQITIEFQIDSPQEHYHVPLLLSPFGYSTYRGS
jgi:5-hydroxyisourate hydrolase